MNLGLSGKLVLVTGGSRGIGAAIAESFLREGANVIIASRGSQNLYKVERFLQDKYPAQLVKAEKCDCADVTDLSKLLERISGHHQVLDCVIANVGDGASVPDAIPGDKEWQNTWGINFDSALYTARTFLPMLEESNGSLLFISSIAGIESIGAPVDYSTAKTAVISLASNMARKLGGRVRVNVIAPGNVLFAGGAWDKKYQDNPAQIEKLIQSTVPMKRFGSVQEVADAAVFLCSERASFVTGATLVVDGGQTVGIMG